MPILFDRLEASKPLANGVIIARCPACAKAGNDSHGNHLKVYRDGRFACVLFPGKDGKAHRKEIWAIVGKHGNRRPPLKFVYTVKVRAT